MNELSKLESFRKELAIAETFEAMKLLNDAAVAYTIFLKRQRIGKEGINEIGKFLVEIETKLGTWLNENFPHGAKEFQGNQYKSGEVEQFDHTKMPVSKHESTRSRMIAEMSEEEKQDIYERLEKEDKFVLPSTVYVEGIRKRREERKYNDPILPEGKYRIVYADPPWKYNDSCLDGSVQAHGAVDKYPVMSVDELCAMKIPETEDNAVLFLWTTSPMLEDAFKVIRAWNFNYKANFVWDKIKHNMGHYNSVRHELLLIATKGSCTPDNLKLYDSVQSIPKDEHSKKPLEFYMIIQTLYTHGDKIELFARGIQDGWDSFGNEL